MSDVPQNDAPRDGAPRKASHTVDLSSGSAPARPKRPKGFAPVVQQTINLTTKREPKAEAPAAAQPTAPRASAPNMPKASDSGTRRRDEAPRKRDEAPRGDARRPPPSGGTSLADLLDEATLARLRGGT